MMTASEISGSAPVRREPSDRRTIDQLASALGLPAWECVDELNTDYYHECAHGVASSVPAEEYSGDEFEHAQLAEQERAQAEVYARWCDGVRGAAESLLGEHGLALECGVRDGAPDRPHALRVVPETTWARAADAIRRTISGVGYFSFATLREFLDSGPYTARRAVLLHLGAVADYPAVYGTASALALYRRSFS